MQRVLRIMGYALSISSNPWRNHCRLLLWTAPERHLQGKIRPWFARKKGYLKNNEWPSLEKKITNYLTGLSLHGRITEELNKSSKERANELIVFIRHPNCSNSKPLENILGNPHYSTHFWYTFLHWHVNHSLITATCLCGTWHTTGSQSHFSTSLVTRPITIRAHLLIGKKMSVAHRSSPSILVPDLHY